VSRRQPRRVVGSRRDEIVEFASDTDVKVSVTVSADKYVWYSQPASAQERAKLRTIPDGSPTRAQPTHLALFLMVSSAAVATRRRRGLLKRNRSYESS